MFNDKDKNQPKGKREDMKGSKVGSQQRVSYKERKKLAVVGRDPKFHYRWVNSDDGKYAGRVEELKAIGYTVCSEEEMLEESGIEGSSVGSVVGKPVGRGIRGILMKQKKEFFEEDQHQKQAEVDETEMGMMPEELVGREEAVGEGLKISRPGQDVQQK